jgi:hypothetical protein
MAVVGASRGGGPRARTIVAEAGWVGVGERDSTGTLPVYQHGTAG